MRFPNRIEKEHKRKYCHKFAPQPQEKLTKVYNLGSF